MPGPPAPGAAAPSGAAAAAQAAHGERYLILASSAAAVPGSAADSGVPLVASTTLHLVRKGGWPGK